MNSQSTPSTASQCTNPQVKNRHPILDQFSRHTLDLTSRRLASLERKFAAAALKQRKLETSVSSTRDLRIVRLRLKHTKFA